jgi:hypothetical protein
MFDDAVCDGSPNLLRPKNEIVFGRTKSTGADLLRRGKFAVKVLCLKWGLGSGFFENPKNWAAPHVLRRCVWLAPAALRAFLRSFFHRGCEEPPAKPQISAFTIG